MHPPAAVAAGFLRSGHTQTCEGKFKKTREFDSYHNYCATTNSDWAAQIDGDDRRFAAIDCDDRWAGPRTIAKTEYFAKLNDPKQGPYNITLAFARYLYELDVDEFEPAAHIPTETDGLRQQKLQSLNPVAALVLQWLERARVIPYTDECDHAELEQWPAITNEDLWTTALCDTLVLGCHRVAENSAVRLQSNFNRK
eukprot:COSAG01_NODE_3856_length_5625_cov_3.453312_1_plen_197_part_00